MDNSSKISLQASTIPCEEATIEIDSKGNIWIAYNTDGATAPNEFVFARRSLDAGQTWSATLDTLSKGGEIGTSIETGRTSFAAGPNGKLVAIWDNSLTGKESRREVFLINLMERVGKAQLEFRILQLSIETTIVTQLLQLMVMEIFMQFMSHQLLAHRTLDQKSFAS